MGAITLLLVLVAIASPAWAYRYTVFLPASTTWTAPAGATDISTTVWGGGGGAAVSGNCGAGGGSGSAVLNRTVNTAGWGIVPSDAQWVITVGQGGAALPLDGGTGGQASDGGETSVVVLAPNGTQLYSVVAYGGGGAKAVWPATTGCRGGAGGGASSSAVGTIPGGGTPAGAADSDPWRRRHRAPSSATSRPEAPAPAMAMPTGIFRCPSSTVPRGRLQVAIGMAARA